MPLTRYPNGLTVNSTSALTYSSSATDGDLDCNRIFVNGAISGSGASAGALTISTATSATFIGERAYITIPFTSAAATITSATPFSGKIIDCWVTCDTTPRTCSGFTLQAGSGGAVAVATVATLVFATAVGQQVQPVLTATPITTASALTVVVTTAGSAGNFQAIVVLQRTS